MAMKSEPRDCELVRRALEGELPAFEALYERYATSIFRTIQAVVRDRHTSEDLLQECFVRAYRNLHRVDQSVESLAPWLHRIALNLAYSRATQKGQPLPAFEVVASILASPLLGPEREVERSELKRAVREAIEALDDRYRLVVVLYYLEELPLGEIAERLNVPAGTVKSRLFYARQQLRNALMSDGRVVNEVGYGLA
jgi:RNA polymerase sigma-70 factor, ECF subfamily